MNAPTQIDAILVPSSAASRNAPSTSSGIDAVGSARPGTTIVSAPANAPSPHGARMAKTPAATSAVEAQTRTLYASARRHRARPKTSTGVDRSKAKTPSSARRPPCAWRYCTYDDSLPDPNLAGSDLCTCLLRLYDLSFWQNSLNSAIVPLLLGALVVQSTDAGAKPSAVSGYPGGICWCKS